MNSGLGVKIFLILLFLYGTTMVLHWILKKVKGYINQDDDR